MNIQEFATEIEKDKDLAILAFDDKKDCFVVKNSELDEIYKCTFDAVCNHSWFNIRRVLYGGDAKILKRMTRIVGYFSQVKNWNKSKIGELKDRQAGNYNIG